MPETGSKVLEFINQHFYLDEDGSLMEAPFFRLKTQPALPGINRKTLKWSKEIDLVVMGPCSQLLPDEMASAFRINDSNRNLRVILVLPSCCGAYSHRHEEAFRQSFPEVEAVFSPHFRDLHRWWLNWAAVVALLQDGVLIPIDRET